MRSKRSRLAAVVAASGAGIALSLAATPAQAVAATPRGPVVQSTAVVIAPVARAHGKSLPQVTVGVTTGNRASASVTIRRSAGNGEQSPFTLETSEAAGPVGEGTGAALVGVRGGDDIEIQLAVSEGTPANPRDINAVVAMRITDLRSGSVVDRQGAASLFKDAPQAPTKEVASSGDDVARTATTWQKGWSGSSAGLDNHALTAASDYAIEGVSQRGTDFFITDRAHPEHAATLGTVRLHARLGDRIVVVAATSPTGTQTSVMVTDRHDNEHVSSAG